MVPLFLKRKPKALKNYSRKQPGLKRRYAANKSTRGFSLTINSWFVEIVAKHVQVVEQSTVASDAHDLAVHLRCHRDVGDVALVKLHMKRVHAHCIIVVVVVDVVVVDVVVVIVIVN